MKTILIIDDSSFQRKIVGSILQEAGYSLLVADNGSDGLRQAETEKPDMVITDLLMPEFDGLYFLEKIRAAQPALPVLVVTSDIQHATREKCNALGAAGFINKPVKRETLLPAVSAVLAGGRP